MVFEGVLKKTVVLRLHEADDPLNARITQHIVDDQTAYLQEHDIGKRLDVNSIRPV